MHGPQVAGDDRSQLSWMAERGEVTAGYDDGLDAEPFASDALLELEREEPVIAAGDDAHRDRAAR